jgi:hypothetical protein
MKDTNADRPPKPSRPARRPDRNIEHSGKGSASALDELRQRERNRALLRGPTSRDKPS